jgi:hypothetical protein
MTSQKNYYLHSRVLFMCKKQLERHYNEEHAPRSIALVKLDENGLPICFVRHVMNGGFHVTESR